MSEVLSVDEIRDTEFPPQKFIIEPHLLPRNGAFIIGAATGVGKSWIALHIAQCLASGAPLFDAVYLKHGKEHTARFPVIKMAKILYLDYELSHQMRKDRLMKALPRGTGLVFARNPSLYGLDERFAALEKLVSEERPDVLIVDPLSSAHHFEENTNELRKAFSRLDKLRDKFNLSVIVNHHASSKIERDAEKKIVLKRPIEMFRGHTSIVDWADLAVALFPLDEKESDSDVPSGQINLRLSFAKTRHTSYRRSIKLKVDCLGGTISLLESST